MRTTAEWVKDCETSSDQRLWDDWVNNGRYWQEDAAHYSADNVLSTVLEARGLLPVSTSEVLWRVLDELFRHAPFEGQIRQHLQNREVLERGKALLAEAFAANENRGKRIATGLFVHQGVEPKTPLLTYKEMRVLDPIAQMVEASAKRQSLLTEGFCRAFIDATGIKPQEAEMFVQRGLVSGESASMGERTLWSERIWFQERAEVNTR